MKMFCNVMDCGSTYLVNNVFKNTSDNTPIISNNSIMLEIKDTAVYDSIVYYLGKSKIVRIPKNVDPLTATDLIIAVNNDNLENEKSAARFTVINVINRSAGSTTNFDFFRFSVLNNKLNAKGYNITGDEKEDQYLNILSSGDDSLIGLLQKFLEVQAKIEEYDDMYDQAQTALQEIDDATNNTEVSQARDKFLSKYYK